MLVFVLAALAGGVWWACQNDTDLTWPGLPGPSRVLVTL